MPKELIHFKIAQRTAALLKNTAFEPCLATHPQSLLLGSVFHDALFYGVTSPARPLERLAHALHGADGQDSYALLRQQTHHAASDSTGIAAAMLVGMTSHVFADIVMHPMIWYFSGDYYADNEDERFSAHQHHRALESLMDMIACPEMIGRTRYSVRLMLKHVGDGVATGIPLNDLAELAGIKSDEARKGLYSAWSVFAIFQSLFPLRSLASSLFATLPWLPKPVARLATLFYAPKLMHQADVLSGGIQYVHPVTGEKTLTTLKKLIENAATQASEFCRTLEPVVFKGSQQALPSNGPSMDSGLSGISTRQMHHFAPTPFPKLKERPIS